MFQVVSIAGSPSEISRSSALLDAVEAALAPYDIHCRRIVVGRLPADELLQRRPTGTELAAALADLTDADAVIVSTPIYKGAYSGLLKAFLDLLPQSGLAGKPVLPLASAGSPAHILAIEYTLKPVLAALGARHLLGGVTAVEVELQRLATGYVIDPVLETRLNAAASQFAEALGATTRRPRLAVAGR